MNEADKQVARYDSAFSEMNRLVKGVARDCPMPIADQHPASLRVGVNAAMSDHSALAKLLMAKGVVTEEEYLAAIADGMEAEVALAAKRFYPAE